jgi:hypothetical protein
MENQVDIGAFAVEHEEMMEERRQGGDKASMSLTSGKNNKFSHG